MVWSAQQIKEAQTHLRKTDLTMKAVIKAVGPFTLRPNRDRFGVLARSIVSQQISTAAANTISERLLEASGGGPLTPAGILALTPDQLRACGLSGRKAEYLCDLASQIESGSIELNQLGRCDDETVIDRLTEVKGIGRWTAQMFLMFSLGRLDVVAHDDLGLKTAIKNLYGLEEHPDREAFETVASPWRPFATVASWYCWRALELGLEKANLPPA